MIWPALSLTTIALHGVHPEKDDVGIHRQLFEWAVNYSAGCNLHLGDVWDLFFSDVGQLAHHAYVLHEASHLRFGEFESHDHRSQRAVVVVFSSGVEHIALRLAPECAAGGDGFADSGDFRGLLVHEGKANGRLVQRYAVLEG